MPPTQPSKSLETFPNPKRGRDFLISIDCPEFTCVCPKTGQPDFGVIKIRYVPDEKCVELKSLKLYLWSFRESGTFHETVTHQVLDDLVAALDPTWMRIEGDFNVRGGLHTRVFAYHGRRPDAVPEPPV
jgi:7-cyano-7-deazaguanine reductase